MTRNVAEVDAAERAFIGSALIAPKTIPQLAAHVQPQQFFDESLGRFWTALIDHHTAVRAIDTVTMASTAKRIWGDSGVAELGDLFTTVPHASHARYYADQIVSGYRVRQFKRIASGLNQRADDLSESPDAIDRWLKEQIDNGIVSSSIRSVAGYDAGVELLNTMEAERALATIETGITELDRDICGFAPGELVILAARPANCKTAFALQIATGAAKRGLPALYISLEMTGAELMSRVLCGECQIDSRKLRSQSLSDQEKKQLFDTNERWSDVPFFVQDASKIDIRQIEAMARLQFESTGLKLLVIDYLGLIDKGHSKLDRREQIAEWSRSLKVMAKELGIPILALVQLNRATDQQTEPRLSNLAESGSIEQDADVVMFLHRPEPERNLLRLLVGKHRHADLSSNDLFLNVNTMQLQSNTDWKP